VHFPNTDGTTATATGSTYSEIWYAYNAPYNSTSDPATGFSGAGATSYDAAAYAQSTGSSTTVTINPKMNGGDTTGTISAYSPVGSQICVGDVVSDSKLPSGTKVTAVPGGGTCSTTTGTVTLDHGVTSGNVNSFTIQPRQIKILNNLAGSLAITSSTGTLATGSATVLNSDGTTLGTISIASGPVSNVYTLSSAPSFSFAGNFVVQGTSGSTIRVASANDMPASANTTWLDSSGTTQPTIYRVWGPQTTNGIGALAANATISSVSSTTNTFTLSATPITPLVGATICAGACAFFNTPNSATTITNFSINPSAGTTQWASGFLCLKNVDPNLIRAVISTSIISRTWSEAVQ
jgi:hypothetical protein